MNRFLVVEDSAFDREFLVRWLERFKAEIICVVDAQGAYNRSRDGKFTAIFINLKLGNDPMAGIAVVRHFSNLDPGMPIFIVTGAEDEQAKVSAVMAGATGFFNKDYSETDAKVVETVLNMRQMALIEGGRRGTKSYRTTISGAFAAMGTFLWGAPLGLTQFPEISLPKDVARWCIIIGLFASAVGIFCASLFARDKMVSDEQAGAGRR